MSTDTQPTEHSPFGPETDRKMAELVAAHNQGQHYYTPRPGCPGCVFGRGRKP